MQVKETTTQQSRAPRAKALAADPVRGRVFLQPLYQGLTIDQFEPVWDVLSDLGIVPDLRGELPRGRDDALACLMIAMEYPEQGLDLFGADDVPRLVPLHGLDTTRGSRGLLRQCEGSGVDFRIEAHVANLGDAYGSFRAVSDEEAFQRQQGLGVNP